MNAHAPALAVFAALLLASPATAEDSPQALPAVEAVKHVFACHALARPTQPQVAAWSGQWNPAQVYATRQRLMTHVARLCQNPRIGQVHLVQRKRGVDGPAVGRIAMVAVDRR
mgnify:CR=1 FL=1